MPFDHASAPERAIRVAVVGAGQRGGAYARALVSGEVPGAVLAAVADPDADARGRFGVAGFEGVSALARAGMADAWVVASPPLEHVPAALAAFRAGAHLLLEKPIATSVADCELLLRAHAGAASLTFATVLPLRTDRRYALLRERLRGGSLGRVRRVLWTVTDCFREDAYYLASAWRRDLGGGVLLNQCLHQLDLLVSLFGMPLGVRAVADARPSPARGVEAAVRAVLELPGGATGVFSASTIEPAGVNRLEVVTERARLTLEHESVCIDCAGHETNLPDPLPAGVEPAQNPCTERVRVPSGGSWPVDELRAFVGAVRGRARVLTKGAEGVASVRLARALLLSSVEGRRVELPTSMLASTESAARDRVERSAEA